jgi:hypothetical protein
MESAGQTPAVAVDAAELVPLFDGPQPVATAYLTTEAEIENAAQRSEQHWKNLRRDMADGGVPEAVLESIDPLVPDAHLEGQTLAVVASEAGIRTVDHFPEPPVTNAFRWGPLPWIGPIVEERQAGIAHVAVAIDRTGADIVLFRPGREDITESVGGDPSLPVSKSKPGGWSQRRYQQRAENTWQENAENVAAEVTKLVERSGARLVVVTGDVRAVQLLDDALSDQVRSLVHVVDAGSVEEETVRLVDTIVAKDTVALLEKFKEEKGQVDRAADGVAATVGALNRAQVEVLLVHADPDDDRTVFVGPDPIPLSLDASELKDLGVDSPVEAPLVDALIRAAAGTGAGVRIVPHAGPVQDRVGAILRWAQ